MKVLTITATMLFALLALGSLDAIGKPQHGGGGGKTQHAQRHHGGHQGHQVHHGHHGHHKHHGGYGGYRGYGNYGVYRPYSSYYYSAPTTPYIQQPVTVIENPLASGQPVKIVNPSANGVALSYLLNDAAQSIPPGSSQDLTLDRSLVIRFSRGSGFGEARYQLEAGVYTFARTDRGWELFHGQLMQFDAAPAPANAPAPPRMPANPPPVEQPIRSTE